MKDKRKILTFFLYFLFLVIIIFFALEIILRLKIFRNSITGSLTEGEWRESGYIYNHPSFSTIKVFNEKGELNSFRTDRFGLNNDDSVYDEGVNEKILILGDSFIESSVTPYNENFVNDLNNIAKDRLQGVIFINGGVDGYANWQSFLLLGRLYKNIKPKTAILMVYLGNDLHDNYQLKPQVAITIKNIVSENPVIDKTMDSNPNVVLRRKIKSFVRNNIIDKIYVLKIAYYYAGVIRQGFNPVFNYDYFNVESYRNKPKQFIRDSIKNTAFILSSFKTYCDKRKINFLVFAIPSKREVYNDFFYISSLYKKMVTELIKDPNGYSFDNPVKYYRNICESLDIPFFDITPFFKNHCKDNIFGAVDFHWSSAGQAKAAYFVYSVLTNNNYLPK